MFESIAYAAPEGAKGAPAFMGMVPILLMFVIFYFLLIRPQQKTQKEHKAMLQTLGKGDRVVTNGGIHGQIVEAKEEVLTVAITDSVRVKVDRSAVARKVVSE
jgi:preprotein translocase subunit YajC